METTPSHWEGFYTCQKKESSLRTCEGEEAARQQGLLRSKITRGDSNEVGPTSKPVKPHEDEPCEGPHPHRAPAGTRKWYSPTNVVVADTILGIVGLGWNGLGSPWMTSAGALTDEA